MTGDKAHVGPVRKKFSLLIVKTMETVLEGQ